MLNVYCMKSVFLYLSACFVLLCSSIPSEDKKPPANLKELHERFMLGFFVGSPDYSKDSTIVVKAKLYADEPELKAYVADQCQSMIGGFYGAFQQAIDEKASYSWQDWYGKSFSNNYQRLLSTNLIKKSVDIKSGTKFNYFDEIALEKTFNALYKKPTEKFKGVATYQRIYDISVKGYGIEVADFIAKVMRNKKGFEKVTALYKKQMETSEEFYGNSYPDKTWQTIFPLAELEKDGDYYNYPQLKCGYASDILLMLIRRNIDGTLPTLLKCFKQILQDYDKTTFNSYKDTF